MLKIALTAGALALLALLSPVEGPASAAEFKNGGNPTFTDLGLSLRARHIISGLAHQRVFVTMTASANVTAECINPDSGHSKPTKQEPEPITVAGFFHLSKARVTAKGNALMVVTTAAPDPEIEGSPDCNSHDVEVITDLAFTSAVITIDQPAGTQVLSAHCTFASPTSDGRVPAGNVSCVSP